MLLDVALCLLVETKQKDLKFLLLLLAAQHLLKYTHNTLYQLVY